jgi:hypothetical protein
MTAMAATQPRGAGDRQLLAAITDGRVWVDPVLKAFYVRQGGRAYCVTPRLRALCRSAHVVWVGDGSGGGIFHVTAKGRAMTS